MVLIFNSVLLSALVAVLTAAVGFYMYLKWVFQYWKRRNVPCPIVAIPFGSLENPLAPKVFGGTQIRRICDALKAQGQKFGGFYMFTKPIFMPVDPQLIKHILQEDFEYFTDRGATCSEINDPLMGNLFFVDGSNWRPLRTKLTPAYTPVKMKSMCDIMLQCGEQMAETLIFNCEKREPMDTKELATRYTIDIVGSCGYGIECNSFKYPDAEFRRYARTVFEYVPPLRLLSIYIAYSFPKLSRWLNITVIPKETTKFFIKVVKDVVEYRDAHKYERGDMIQLLINLRDQLKDSKKEENFTIVDMAAQVFGFFAAGFESSSMTMTFCLYELAVNPDIQEKLRGEVHQMIKKHNGKLSLEAISDMKYMNQVVDETLRKHPPVTLMVRKCVKNYDIPDSDLVLEKGTSIILSVMSLHRDPDYFPDPEKFDPERFSPENKEKIVPCTYLPFGEGPRNCIGLRFGLLQTKVGLSVLLRDYKFSLNKNTVEPIAIHPRALTRMPLHPLLLDVEKISI